MRRFFNELLSYPPEFWDMFFLMITVPVAILVVMGMH